MRPVLHGDLSAAACVLLHADPADRPRLMRDMLDEAESGDRHRLQTGQAHPRWGNGSLMAVALTRARASEPFLDDPDYAGCLIRVLTELQARPETGLVTRARTTRR